MTDTCYELKKGSRYKKAQFYKRKVEYEFLVQNTSSKLTDTWFFYQSISILYEQQSLGFSNIGIRRIKPWLGLVQIESITCTSIHII